MLDLAPATIRTWEARYGHVVPQRSGGGQRLYSREQVDQLQFVKDQVAAGHRPAAAHRLLAERGDDFSREPPRVLLAESRLGAADSLRRLVGTDDFEVVVAADAETASRKVEELGLSL